MQKAFTLLVCVFAALAQSASATVITHGVGGTYTENHGVIFTDSMEFDRAEFMFAPEYVDTITIANASDAFVNNHGLDVPALLQVYNGTNWLTVLSAPIAAGSNLYLEDLFATPVTFAGLTISGLRLNVTPWVGWAYHNVPDRMTYTLSGTPNAVTIPEPGSVALLGLGFVGIAVMRRKQAAAA